MPWVFCVIFTLFQYMGSGGLLNLEMLSGIICGYLFLWGYLKEISDQRATKLENSFLLKSVKDQPSISYYKTLRVYSC
jgi:hypothetical protein